MGLSASKCFSSALIGRFFLSTLTRWFSGSEFYSKLTESRSEPFLESTISGMLSSLDFFYKFYKDIAFSFNSINKFNFALISKLCFINVSFSSILAINYFFSYISLFLSSSKAFYFSISFSI